MKQKDIGLIIVVVFISVILSVVISGKIFTPPKNRQQAVQTVQAISTQFTQPPAKYFNANSQDFTQLIQIGSASNANPFSGQ